MLRTVHTHAPSPSTSSAAIMQSSLSPSRLLFLFSESLSKNLCWHWPGFGFGGIRGSDIYSPFPPPPPRPFRYRRVFELRLPFGLGGDCWMGATFSGRFSPLSLLFLECCHQTYFRLRRRLGRKLKTKGGERSRGHRQMFPGLKFSLQ